MSRLNSFKDTLNNHLSTLLFAALVGIPAIGILYTRVFYGLNALAGDHLTEKFFLTFSIFYFLTPLLVVYLVYAFHIQHSSTYHWWRFSLFLIPFVVAITLNIVYLDLNWGLCFWAYLACIFADHFSRKDTGMMVKWDTEKINSLAIKVRASLEILLIVFALFLIRFFQDPETASEGGWWKFWYVPLLIVCVQIIIVVIQIRRESLPVQTTTDQVNRQAMYWITSIILVTLLLFFFTDLMKKKNLTLSYRKNSSNIYKPYSKFYAENDSLLLGKSAQKEDSLPTQSFPKKIRLTFGYLDNLQKSKDDIIEQEQKIRLMKVSANEWNIYEDKQSLLYQQKIEQFLKKVLSKEKKKDSLIKHRIEKYRKKCPVPNPTCLQSYLERNLKKKYPQILNDTSYKKIFATPDILTTQALPGTNNDAWFRYPDSTTKKLRKGLISINENYLNYQRQVYNTQIEFSKIILRPLLKQVQKIGLLIFLSTLVLCGFLYLSHRTNKHSNLKSMVEVVFMTVAVLMIPLLTPITYQNINPENPYWAIKLANWDLLKSVSESTKASSQKKNQGKRMDVQFGDRYFRQSQRPLFTPSDSTLNDALNKLNESLENLKKDKLTVNIESNDLESLNREIQGIKNEMNLIKKVLIKKYGQ